MGAEANAWKVRRAEYKCYGWACNELTRMRPCITIVTPSYNQGEFIESTIHSVLSQGYPNLQYIVIDGGSSDQTVDVLKRHSHRLSHWVSEPDGGQAEALNKGFARATGSIMYYLNSDDMLLPGALESVSRFFEAHPDKKWLASSTLVGSDPVSATIWYPRVESLEEFLAGQSFSQQGVFWRANILPHPWFDEQFNFILDAEFFTRLYRACGRPAILPETTSFFRLHAEAKTSRISDVMESEAPLLLSRSKDLFSSYTLKRIKRSASFNRFLCLQSEFRQHCKTGRSSLASDLSRLRISMLFLEMTGMRGVWRGLPIICKSILLAAIHRCRVRACMDK